MTGLLQTEAFDVEKVRADFPILKRKVHGKRLVYLDNAATTQKPQAVIDALVDYYSRYNSNVHRSVHTLGEEATAAYEASRERVAKFVGGQPREAVFVRGTTEATNLVRYAWGEKHIAKGDLLVSTRMEHHSNIVPWQLLARSRGATLKFVELTPDGHLDMGSLEELLRESPRLVAFTHCSNVLGTINDAAAICAKAHAAGAVTVVDGAQSVPHFPVDLARIGADFYAFSVTGDTPVLVEDESGRRLVPIEEAVTMQRTGANLAVLSLDDHGGLRFERVRDSLSHYDDVYAIRHENSALELRATAHHSVYVWECGDIREAKVADLKAGDYLVTFSSQSRHGRVEKRNLQFTYTQHNHAVTEAVRLTNPLMRLIGYYLAEGSVDPSDSRVSLAFSEVEEAYVADSASIARQLETTRYYTNAASQAKATSLSTIVAIAERVGVSEKTAAKYVKADVPTGFARERKVAVRVDYNRRSHTKNVSFNSKKWSQFFDSMCGRGAANKHLPPFVWEADSELVANLLKGYLRGDASKNEKHRLVSKTVSKRLASELSWLLKLHGVPNSLGFSRSRSPRWHDQFVLVIQRSALGQLREFHRKNQKTDSPRDASLCVDGLREVYFLAKPKYDFHISSLLRSKKKRTTRAGISRITRWIRSYHSAPLTVEMEEVLDRYDEFARGDIGLLKVKGIRPDGRRLVYDVSVANTERFFGGYYPVLLHNSGHKMLGPTGIGVLMGKKQLLQDMDPFEGGGEMIREVFDDHSTWNDVPYKFEAGTVNIADAIGLGAAVDYLTALGMDNVRKHEVRLLDYARDVLSGVKGLQVYGPEDSQQRSGLVAFNYADVHPHDLATILDEEGVAIRSGHHCAQLLMRCLDVPATSRASFHVYNSYDDIDALKQGIMKAGAIFKV